MSRTATTAPCRGVEQEGEDLLVEVARRADLPVVGASGLELLHRGVDHFYAILTRVAAARHEVLVEMYEVTRDPVGRELMTALAAAGGRGVEVRLLLDRFGSGGIASWLPTLRRVGVNARWYNPWRPWNSPFHRTHRKLVVVDGRVASLGGVNFGAEFSECHAGREAWRDVSAWLEGSAVATLRSQFEAAWTAWGGDPLPVLSIPAKPEVPCALAGGRDGRRGHAATYLALSATARRELLLTTPYFLPGPTLRRALCAAVEQGVRVVVVVPRRADIAAFKHGSRALYQPLLQRGVEIWERTDRMVHAKVAVVDGRLAAVGSANLNRRSLCGNSETLLLTADRRVVRELRSLVLEESAAHADALCPLRWPLHPDRRRWAELASTAAAMVF